MATFLLVADVCPSIISYHVLVVATLSPPAHFVEGFFNIRQLSWLKSFQSTTDTDRKFLSVQLTKWGKQECG